MRIDPTGTLEAGEVHIKSSHRNLLGADGQVTELIEGDVLVRRSSVFYEAAYPHILIAYSPPMQSTYGCPEGMRPHSHWVYAG